MAIDLDLRNWPLVFTRFEGSQTIEDVDGDFERTASIHERKQPWMSVAFMNGYIQPIPCPYMVCGTLNDALAFVRKKAAECSLSLPPELPSRLP